MILLLFEVGKALLVLPYCLHVISALPVQGLKSFLNLFHSALLELLLNVTLCVNCVAIQFP